MNVDRLKAVHDRLTALIKEGGDPAAISAQLVELGSAIDELEKRPQRYIPVEMLTLSPYWKQWPETLGYAENPWVRTDYITVVLEVGKSWYAAKLPGGSQGTYLMDRRDQRRRTWKHAQTAMACIDRDYACGNLQTWVEMEASDARPQ
jgi:hypothetical protein